MPERRWEHGSDFHWPSFDPVDSGRSHPWPAEALLLATGRDCIAELVRTRRASRCWVPSYFCQDVLAGLSARGVSLRVYPDRPGESPKVPVQLVEPGDIVLVVNFFGLRGAPSLPDLKDAGAVILEDHTHDPWSNWARHSTAQYCTATLRKTLPVGDGAVLWSRGGLELPAARPASEATEAASSRRLRAALLKRLYLDGHAVDKVAFRELAVAGEEGLAEDVGSGMTAMSRQLLDVFPCEAWRERRLSNYHRLEAELSALEGLTVLGPQSPQAVPYVVAVLFENQAKRDTVRSALIAASIYPALLWSLDEPVVEGVEPADQALARRGLVLHCDWRYDESDVARVVATLREAL